MAELGSYVDEDDECDHEWEFEDASSFDADFECEECGKTITVYKEEIDYTFGIPVYEREKAKESIKEKRGDLYGENKSTSSSIRNLEENNPSCFIATAAYGTPFAFEIDILRHWRDKSLKINYIGNLFVRFYYLFSPKIADFIRTRNYLRKLVRKCLNLFVKYLIRKYNK